jgi:hypothetical protein
VFQVAEIKKLSAQENNKARVKALQAENEQLRKEIEEWKNKLIELEIADGINQVTLQFRCFNFYSLRFYVLTDLIFVI